MSNLINKPKNKRIKLEMSYINITSFSIFASVIGWQIRNQLNKISKHNINSISTRVFFCLVCVWICVCVVFCVKNVNENNFQMRDSMDRFWMHSEKDFDCFVHLLSKQIIQIQKTELLLHTRKFQRFCCVNVLFEF